jgi:type II secretory pathway pseudopilin PulG
MSSTPRHIRPAELMVRCGRAPRAFTLIEALVAVGAMALVTVGIAAIFSSVGKTVAAGRRISMLNSYAAMVEQQMRHDFEGMTREGFLMVRHSYADVDGDGFFDAPPLPPAIPPPGTDAIQLTAQDGRPRARRIDEIMFFADGDFTSVREPLHPAYVARSKNARIYYGHGTRLPTTVPSYSQPQIDDANSVATTGRLGQDKSPNQYAASWTLLRHVTLLVNPESTTPKLPPDNVFRWSPTRARDAAILRDKDGQVALQPASSSLFRSLAYVLPQSSGNAIPPYVRPRRPRFGSGLVDIATNDLTDVRSIVMGMPNPATAFNAGSITNPNEYPPADPLFGVPPNPGWIFTPGPAAVINARSWMENAWPTSSDTFSPATFPDAVGDRGTRIRFEPGPPDYVDVITRASSPPEQAYRRADQMALAAFNFVPGCTEFIVEWSFGDTDQTNGQVIWHGLERRADVDNNGVMAAIDKTLARPYPRDSSDSPPGGKNAFFYQTYTALDGTVHGSADPVARVDPALIYANPATDPTTISQSAYFGYFDPTDNQGRPWPWPSLIRVTMSLTDPKNPGVEETFQFVFPTPGNPK